MDFPIPPAYLDPLRLLDFRKMSHPPYYFDLRLLRTKVILSW